MNALTKRQLQVVMLAANGLTNIEIANELGIQASSVKCHVDLACKKLSARNRTHMVHRAHVTGYLGMVDDVQP